jgi:hypothetical protein
MPHGKSRYAIVVLDLEEGDIAGRAEGDEQFAQLWVIAFCLAAGKWKFFQDFTPLRIAAMAVSAALRSRRSRNA